MYIDIVRIWFGIANGQISQSLTELSARGTIMAGYYSLTFLFINFQQSYCLCLATKMVFVQHHENELMNLDKTSDMNRY